LDLGRGAGGSENAPTPAGPPIQPLKLPLGGHTKGEPVSWCGWCVWFYGLVLCGLGLVSAGFAVLSGFMYFVLASAALAAFCLVLFDFGLSASFPVLLASRASRWSRLLSLRFAWFCMVLGWSLAVSAVLCGFMYFALVSAALAAFGLVLCGFGLVSAGFAVLYGFVYFVLVAAALAAFCLVLGWSLRVSLFCAGFALLC